MFKKNSIHATYGILRNSASLPYGRNRYARQISGYPNMVRNESSTNAGWERAINVW